MSVMKNILLVVAAVLCVSIVSSCKKTSAHKNPFELITERAWLVSNLELSLDSINYVVHPDWTNLQLCEKDNLYHFNTNYTYRVSENTFICSSGIEETGTWGMISDNTIHLDGTKFTIVEITESKFVIQGGSAIGGGVYFITRLSFSR